MPKVDQLMSAIDEVLHANEVKGFRWSEKVIAFSSELRAMEHKMVELQKDSDLLNALEAAGVDGWEGYDDARQMA